MFRFGAHLHGPSHSLKAGDLVRMNPKIVGQFSFFRPGIGLVLETWMDRDSLTVANLLIGGVLVRAIHASWLDWA